MQKGTVTESLHTAAELYMTVIGKMTVLTVTVYLLIRTAENMMATGQMAKRTVREK